MNLQGAGWLASVLLLVLLWAILVGPHGDVGRLPGPMDVANVFVANRQAFAHDAYITSGLAARGLLLASIVALLIVALVSVFPKFEALLYPYIVMLKASPAVAFAPLLVVWFHSGPRVKIVVAALISFFPMVIGGIDGLKRCPKRLLRFSRVYRPSQWRIAALVNGPYGVSGFLSGMKTAAPLSIVGAIVGEFVDASDPATSGIGVYIASHARGQFMDHVFGGVIVATVIGLLFFLLVYILSTACERVLHLDQ